MNHVFAIPSVGLSHSKEERTSGNQMETLGLPCLSYFSCFALPDTQPCFPAHPHYGLAWASSLNHFSGHSLSFPVPGSFLHLQTCNSLFILSGFSHFFASLFSPSSLQTCAVLLPRTPHSPSLALSLGLPHHPEHSLP